MEKETLQRWGFLLFSVVLLICAAGWEPTIYGNDEASIKRYLYQEQEWGDHIWILAVEDYGEDRFAVFQMETKRPDERFIVRFRRNGEGDYELRGASRKMYPERHGILYSRPLGGGAEDREVCYVIWSQLPEPVWFHWRLNGGPEEIIPIPSGPSFTLKRFQSASGSWSLSVSYYTADGEEF